MKQVRLGRGGPKVSEWCLGTMTYGTQTNQNDAHLQIDKCIDAGINFLDTAEMYPVNPVSAETVGRSERIIGNWVQDHGHRDDLVIATKVSGRNGGFVRDGDGFSAANMREAVEGSLRRLRTDYIDLYQLHWPDRGSYMFRQNWTYDPSGQSRDQTLTHMDDILGVLKDLVSDGKIRAFGLSNESAWGTTRWVDRASAAGGPRAVAVQNEYSLMCRLYDTDMAEMAVNEDITLLAFSPLAAGILSGKYLGGAVPEGSRRSLVPNMGGRVAPREDGAAQAYVDLARVHGIDPVHMALAWQTTRPFPVVPIFGATTTQQLDHILAGADVTLTAELVAALDDVQRQHPMPY